MDRDISRLIGENHPVVSMLSEQANTCGLSLLLAAELSCFHPNPLESLESTAVINTIRAGISTRMHTQSTHVMRSLNREAAGTHCRRILLEQIKHAGSASLEAQ